MKFDDIWNAEPPNPVVRKPSWIDRQTGDFLNHIWYRPVAFFTAVLSRSARS